jgi:hypothetical protein
MTNHSGKDSSVIRCWGNADPTDTHLLSTVVAADEETETPRVIPK